MTKQDLQKELLEKVKPGTKPSDIRKLKRSKSADDIPSAPPLPQSTPLRKSHSEIPTQSSSKPTITQLQEQVRFHAETAQNYLKSLQVSQAKVSELEQKLKEKAFHNPAELTELDQALFARHQNLKSWFTQYSKNKSLDQELAENIDEASEELINQDQIISQLRSENRKLKLTNQSLQKDLDLAQRAVAWRKSPLSPLPSNSPWLPYALTFCLIGATLYLTIR